MSVTLILDDGLARVDAVLPKGMKFTEVTEKSMLINGIITPLESELEAPGSHSFHLFLDKKPVARLTFNLSGFHITRYPSLDDDRCYHPISVTVATGPLGGLL